MNEKNCLHWKVYVCEIYHRQNLTFGRRVTGVNEAEVRLCVTQKSLNVV